MELAEKIQNAILTKRLKIINSSKYGILYDPIRFKFYISLNSEKDPTKWKFN